ncbi:hypothetical protein F5Y01DRAFT_312881 [Xylaria sp. FL0043]|nr:hypothetical protein F5Y01DRAFT_312881 [Xylaria sp. FL0043]
METEKGEPTSLPASAGAAALLARANPSSSNNSHLSGRSFVYGQRLFDYSDGTVFADNLHILIFGVPQQLDITCLQNKLAKIKTVINENEVDSPQILNKLQLVIAAVPVVLSVIFFVFVMTLVIRRRSQQQ